MEQKQNTWASWASEIGKHLIKKVEVTIGPTTTTMRTCKKCGIIYEDSFKDDETTKMWRQLRDKSGDLDVCYKCDKPFINNK